MFVNRQPLHPRPVDPVCDTGGSVAIGYDRFFTCMDGPMSKPGGGKRASVMAVFYFDQDTAHLFPYINAVAPWAELYDSPPLVRFVFNEVHCVLYPRRCIATPFPGRQEAAGFRDEFMGFLNDVAGRTHEIRPKHRVFKKVPVTRILKILPGTNCGECGFTSCVAFAAMLSCQKVPPSRCPHLIRPTRVTYPALDDAGCQVSSVTLDVDQDPLPGNEPAEAAQLPESRRVAVTPAQSITARECEVLQLMGQGRTNNEISQTLNISPHTVKSHVINVFNKLGVNDRTQAAVWAVRHHLI